MPLRLECVVQGSPPLQVTWSKGGFILKPGPHLQLVFKNGVCRLIIPHSILGKCFFKDCEKNNIGKQN